jgi:DNA-damage-inducible protein J
MAKTAMTHARISPEIKQEAEKIIKKLGLSISAAHELFYRQIIAHQGVPFELRVFNKASARAMRDAREGKGKRYETVDAMFKDLDL